MIDILKKKEERKGLIIDPVAARSRCTYVKYKV
jgi:hypothetical protein